jgi:hypothetical protein
MTPILEANRGSSEEAESGAVLADQEELLVRASRHAHHSTLSRQRRSLAALARADGEAAGGTPDGTNFGDAGVRNPRPFPRLVPKGDGDLLDALKSMKPLIAQYGAEKVKEMVDLLGWVMCNDAQRPLNPRTAFRLENHRADHANITGQPFQHFFCPILFADEDTELMQGHVINEGFKGSPGTWAVQRKDVDNFFGAFFESDYLLSQRMTGKRVLDFFFDKVLFRLARPELYFEGRNLHYFLRFGKDRTKPVPNDFVTLDITHNGQEVQLCIRNDGLTETPSVQHLDFVTVKDLRLPAFVSLLKAAHLSMFSLFGYRYVYSEVCWFSVNGTNDVAL